MKTTPYVVMLAACLPLSAHAANWVDVLATEPADAPAIKPFGFVQPTYTYIDADPLTGLGARHQRQRPVPDPEHGDANFRKHRTRSSSVRAQFGLRGRLTDKINYFLLTDVGTTSPRCSIRS